MTDIQRWAYLYGGAIPFAKNPGGGWVTYADHIEALAAARADERVSAELHDYHMPAWTAGYRQAVADCIAAVYALVTTRGYDLDDYSAAEAIAALRGLQEGGQ